MNKKLIIIGIIGMFLLASIPTLSGMEIKTTIKGNEAIRIKHSPSISSSNLGNGPPYLKITKPRLGIYVENEKKISFPVTIVVGDIDIEVDATAVDGRIIWVRLYIDGRSQATRYREPYVWKWDKLSFGGRHTLTVETYDDSNKATDEIKVWKWM